MEVSAAGITVIIRVKWTVALIREISGVECRGRHPAQMSSPGMVSRSPHTGNVAKVVVDAGKTSSFRRSVFSGEHFVLVSWCSGFAGVSALARQLAVMRWHGRVCSERGLSPNNTAEPPQWVAVPMEGGILALSAARLLARNFLGKLFLGRVGTRSTSISVLSSEVKKYHRQCIRAFNLYN